MDPDSHVLRSGIICASMKQQPEAKISCGGGCGAWLSAAKAPQQPLHFFELEIIRRGWVVAIPGSSGPNSDALGTYCCWPCFDKHIRRLLRKIPTMPDLPEQADAAD